MPQFEMPLATGARDFAKLDTFTQGYVEAIFFTECTADNEELEDMTFDDLAELTLAEIISDCTDFQESFAEELDAATEQFDYDMNRAGVDFWLTRNRHGVGFWDRGLGGIGDKLTEMAHPYGSRNAYAGDDGKLYLG